MEDGTTGRIDIRDFTMSHLMVIGCFLCLKEFLVSAFWVFWRWFGYYTICWRSWVITGVIFSEVSGSSHNAY